MIRNSFFIAKNGIKPLIILFAIFLISTIVSSIFIQLLLFVSLVLATVFYRNPEREYSVDNLAIFAPIDGEIVDINREDGRYYILIEPSFFDVHLLRLPIGGKSDIMSHIKGLSISTKDLIFKKFNEKVLIKFESDIELEIVNGSFSNGVDVSLLSKDINKRAGERFGFLASGYVKLYLPIDIGCKVAVGDKVLASETILARLD